MKAIAKRIFCLLFLFQFSWAVSFANETDGRALAQKVFDRDRGDNSISIGQMVLVDKNGKKRSRSFISKRKMEGELEQQLLRFTAPADIDGTGFLTIEKPGWETEQFLYLPALKRTRRIVSSQKGHRFVNSDLTYEDMERHPVDDYEYRLVGSETIKNIDCYILESRPKKGTESQYSLIISRISKDSLLGILVHYFDKKGKHFKTYKVLKVDRIQGIWTEALAMVEDFQRGHKTYMKLESITYNTQINADEISRRGLENY